MGGAPMSSTKPVDNAADAFLNPHDGVAISFWIISIAMIASTFFFFLESATVSTHWQTSLHARVLGAGAPVAHCVQIRGLDHHSPIADDRVQFDPEGSAKACHAWHVLEVAARHCCHAGLRLHG